MNDLQPGDIWACFGADRTSRLISWGTAPFGILGPRGLFLGPSHVAIAAELDGRIVWVESTMMAPRRCLVRDRFVHGCQVHDPEDRIVDYLKAGGSVDLYRLSPIDRLARDERIRLSEILIKHHVKKGVDYDLLDALFSGTAAGRFLARKFGTNRRAFCSELIAKTLMRLGRLNRSNANKFNPGKLLRRLVRDGTYTRIRSEETAEDSMIFPIKGAKIDGKL